MQDTSLDAYFYTVLPEINAKQLAVLKIFQENPTMDFTNWELSRELKWEINSVVPRVYELRGRDKRFPMAHPILVESQRRPNRIKVYNIDGEGESLTVKNNRKAIAWQLNPEVAPGGYKID